MKQKQKMSRAVTWCALVGFCLQTPLAISMEPVNSTKTPAAISMVDISLAPGGVLAGQVVNAQGHLQAGQSIVIQSGNKVVAKTVSDKNGGYVVHGLHGGVYQITTDGNSIVCRLWAAETAPPVAKPGLLMVTGPNAVRGQWEQGTFGSFLENAKYTMTNPLVVGGIIAAAVAIPVAIHNSNNDSPSSS